ncbi:MAG TPA: hypothetical protein PKA88_16465 [Polyangiaceae bacterium]|nr:hypothetical protein [Polyangiaceae bacterium]HMR77955.1 hypothetical protein [Polyangiaceae bacterium]
MPELKPDPVETDWFQRQTPATTDVQEELCDAWFDRFKPLSSFPPPPGGER